jgi:Tol biopolymer transport system component
VAVVSRTAVLILIPLSAVAWAWSSSTGDRHSKPLATHSSAPIAFVRGKNWRELVTIRPDGSSLRVVTRVRRGEIFGFSWSPNGRKLAFQVDGAEHETLYVVNANGKGLRRLARWRDTYGAEPAWSPRGRTIVFDRHDDGVHQISVINADGSGARRLTPPGSWRFPSWSPDGSRIVMGAADGVWVMRANGRNRKRVIRADLEGSAPDWSPGNKIAFYIGDDLWVANADGSGRRIAVKDGEASYEPSGIEFSPDGRLVAFQAFYAAGNSELVVAGISGGQVRRLTDNKLADYGPSWSADGKALAFGRSVPGGPGDIWVMNADGTGERNLTNSATDESLPVWAAKG